MVIDVEVSMDHEMIGELLTECISMMIAQGLLPGFMLCTLLHLLGYGIFKGLTVLNIRS